jgi:hypothetical protein
VDKATVVSILQRYVTGEIGRQEIVDQIWSIPARSEGSHAKDFLTTMSQIYDLFDGPEIDGLRLTPEDVIRKINGLLAQSLSEKDLIDWAEDLLLWDVMYESGAEDLLNEVLHTLANMDVQGFEFSKEEIKALRKRLTDTYAIV